MLLMHYSVHGEGQVFPQKSGRQIAIAWGAKYLSNTGSLSVTSVTRDERGTRFSLCFSVSGGKYFFKKIVHPHLLFNQMEGKFINRNRSNNTIYETTQVPDIQFI